MKLIANIKIINLNKKSAFDFIGAPPFCIKVFQTSIIIGKDNPIIYYIINAFMSVCNNILQYITKFLLLVREILQISKGVYECKYK
jgi:hypothetical protein